MHWACSYVRFPFFQFRPDRISCLSEPLGYFNVSIYSFNVCVFFMSNEFFLNWKILDEEMWVVWRWITFSRSIMFPHSVLVWVCVSMCASSWWWTSFLCHKKRESKKTYWQNGVSTLCVSLTWERSIENILFPFAKKYWHRDVNIGYRVKYKSAYNEWGKDLNKVFEESINITSFISKYFLYGFHHTLW